MRWRLAKRPRMIRRRETVFAVGRNGIPSYELILRRARIAGRFFWHRSPLCGGTEWHSVLRGESATAAVARPTITRRVLVVGDVVAGVCRVIAGDLGIRDRGLEWRECGLRPLPVPKPEYTDHTGLAWKWGWAGGNPWGPALADGGTGDPAAGSAGPAIGLVGGDRIAGPGLLGALLGAPRGRWSASRSCRADAPPEPMPPLPPSPANPQRRRRRRRPGRRLRHGRQCRFRRRFLDHPRRHWPGWLGNRQRFP